MLYLEKLSRSCTMPKFTPSATLKLDSVYIPSLLKQKVERGDISPQEIRQEYIRLSNIMRKRQRAINKNSIYKQYGVNNEIPYISTIKTEAELYKQLSYLGGRLNAPTATVTGIKDIIRRTKETLREVKYSPEGEIIRQEVKHINSYEDLKRFGNFMEKKRSEVDKALWKLISSQWVDEWNIIGEIV